MRVLVTGCAGHLGDALRRSLPSLGLEVRGMDLVDDGKVDVVGSITDRLLVEEAMEGVDAVVHAAALHKPHVALTSKRSFVETNIDGTLSLLEAAARASISAFVLTSTTSAFGRALVDSTRDAATWIDERVVGPPKNIYGATKVAAEGLAELVHHERGLPVVILRTSRFFPEPDDDPARAAELPDLNLKVVELLHRRADLEDLVAAHVAAIERARHIGFGRYVASATTPFWAEDRHRLMTDVRAVVADRCGAGVLDGLDALGWSLPSSIDRVYDSTAARRALQWEPRYTFEEAISRANAHTHPFSDLTRAVGLRSYEAALTSRRTSEHAS